MFSEAIVLLYMKTNCPPRFPYLLSCMSWKKEGLCKAIWWQRQVSLYAHWQIVSSGWCFIVLGGWGQRSRWGEEEVTLCLLSVTLAILSSKRSRLLTHILCRWKMAYWHTPRCLCIICICSSRGKVKEKETWGEIYVHIPTCSVHCAILSSNYYAHYYELKCLIMIK